MASVASCTSTGEHSAYEPHTSAAGNDPIPTAITSSESGDQDEVCDSDSDYLPESENPTETDSAASTSNSWRTHLPEELSSDKAWLAFFEQQVHNCRQYKRWSVR